MKIRAKKVRSSQGEKQFAKLNVEELESRLVPRIDASFTTLAVRPSILPNSQHIPIFTTIASFRNVSCLEEMNFISPRSSVSLDENILNACLMIDYDGFPGCETKISEAVPCGSSLNFRIEPPLPVGIQRYRIEVHASFGIILSGPYLRIKLNEVLITQGGLPVPTTRIALGVQSVLRVYDTAFYIKEEPLPPAETLFGYQQAVAARFSAQLYHSEGYLAFSPRGSWNSVKNINLWGDFGEGTGYRLVRRPRLVKGKLFVDLKAAGHYEIRFDVSECALPGSSFELECDYAVARDVRTRRWIYNIQYNGACGGEIGLYLVQPTCFTFQSCIKYGLDIYSPACQTIVGGNQSVFAGSFRLDSELGGFLVQRMQVGLSNPQAACSVQYAALYDPSRGTYLASSYWNGCFDFGGFNLPLPRDECKWVQVYLQLGSLVSPSSHTGENLQIVLESVTGVNCDTGETAVFNHAVPAGDIFAYKSILEFCSAPLANQGPNLYSGAPVSLESFNVKAFQDIASMKQFSMAVVIGQGATGEIPYVDNLHLFCNGIDITTLGCFSSSYVGIGLNVLTFTFATEQVLPPGYVYNFTVWGLPHRFCTSPGENSFLSTQLTDQIIWSDMSCLGHGPWSDDWFIGHLPSLPLDPRTWWCL